MRTRLIAALITVVFIIESAGVELSSSITLKEGSCLRPIASSLSRKMGDSSSSMPLGMCNQPLPVKTLRMSSSGEKDNSDESKDLKTASQKKSYGLRDFDIIVSEFSTRNHMWLKSDEAGKGAKEKRLKYVIERTRDIPNFLVEKFKDEEIIGVIVLGDYLWFERASGIELLIITEGKNELEVLEEDFIPIKELLKDKKISLTGIRNIAATIGYDSLKELSTWEVFCYAARGWREGITIFGEDPYKAEELSSCAEKIQHLDFLLNSSEISLKELERVKLTTAEEELHKGRIKERTAEAISMLKEMAARYRKEEVIVPLKDAEKEPVLPELHQLKKYCQQARKAYDRFMKELKAKPPAPRKKELKAKPPAHRKKELRVKTEELTPKSEGLSRAERLKLILEKHTELDTPEKLLAYIKKHDPHLLDAISKEKQFEFLRDFMFLGYETIPLPKAVLEQLTAPGMYAGKRIATIRWARRLRPKDMLTGIAESVKRGIARSKHGIAQSTYSGIERSKGLPRLGNLFDISRELITDPIYIIDGRSWDSASCDLSDHEKMRLCRLRKGWTLKQCVMALEKAGLKFTAQSKIATVKGWEKGEIIPDPEQRTVIRRVYVDTTLYEKVDAQEAAGAGGEAVEVEEKAGRQFLDGVPHTKIHCFFASHPEASGMSPSQIEEAYDIPAVSIRAFLRKNPTAVKKYNVAYPEKDKPPARKQKAKGRPPVGRRAIAQLETAEAAEEAAEEVVTVGLETKEAEPGKMPGIVIIEGAEADSAVYTARDVWECLRTPGYRDIVDGMDVEDAIYDLEFICYEAQVMIEKEVDPKRQKKAMRQWRLIEAKDMLLRLKSLVSTELCDWDSPTIGQKATEITKGIVYDSDRFKKIKEWVEGNITLVPEYKGCWNTRASETQSLLKGTYFNRANLIVAMLRSIGIPARYRILSFRKETAEAKVSAKGRETTEHIVPEAFICIDEQWNDLLSETRRKYRWISLEGVDAEKVIGPSHLENIDEFASRKAGEKRRRARGGIGLLGELKKRKAIRQSA